LGKPLNAGAIMMIPFEAGETIDIVSYKHGENFHRRWQGAKVLSSEDILIVSNYNPKVTEADGRKHTYPGLSIALFYPNQWWNIVMIYRYSSSLVSYYCNIASPFQVDLEKR
jgi:protein associated with RNAse G/E